MLWAAARGIRVEVVAENAVEVVVEIAAKVVVAIAVEVLAENAVEVVALQGDKIRVDRRGGRLKGPLGDHQQVDPVIASAEGREAGVLVVDNSAKIICEGNACAGSSASFRTTSNQPFLALRPIVLSQTLVLGRKCAEIGREGCVDAATAADILTGTHPLYPP